MPANRRINRRAESPALSSLEHAVPAIPEPMPSVQNSNPLTEQDISEVVEKKVKSYDAREENISKVISEKEDKDLEAFEKEVKDFEAFVILDRSDCMLIETTKVCLLFIRNWCRFVVFSLFFKS